MFDIVGKRRWFFLFSALVTIPGLFFILLTPITNGAAGLKFSIDYTGGTEWSIKFQNPDVSAEAVHDELIALGQDEASVVRTGRGFLRCRRGAPRDPGADLAPGQGRDHSRAGSKDGRGV